MPIQRQTASFLQKRFEEVGIRPQKHYGQNFLIDLNLIDVLVEAADLQPQDVVLEIGTGTGALTGMMAERAGAVVTIEVDPQLHQLACEELVDCGNVTLLRQDALKNKNQIHPNVLNAVKEALDRVPNARFKFAANLPYNIATPLISNLLLTDITPDSMTVTIQKELAERIVAKPRTKDYSSLSVWVQSNCEASIVRILPPTVFWPRPKVDSAIIHVKPKSAKRERIPDLKRYHTFVRAMFFHRRKFMRSVMISAFKNELQKPHIDEIMQRAGLTAESRSEEQSVEKMLEIFGHAEAVLAEVAAAKDK